MSCEIARLQHGIGARCSVLRKFLHPAALVETIIPNTVHGVHVSELLTIRQEVRKVNRKDHVNFAVVFQVLSYLGNTSKMYLSLRRTSL